MLSVNRRCFQFVSLSVCRFINLLDSALPHLVPAWDYSLGTFNQIKVSRPKAFNMSFMICAQQQAFFMCFFITCVFWCPLEHKAVLAAVQAPLSPHHSVPERLGDQ